MYIMDTHKSEEFFFRWKMELKRQNFSLIMIVGATINKCHKPKKNYHRNNIRYFNNSILKIHYLKKCNNEKYLNIINKGIQATKLNRCPCRLEQLIFERLIRLASQTLERQSKQS